MRGSIRNQFLAPLILLLLGLVGVCTWTALGSARAAKRRIAVQMQGVLHTLGEARYPLTQHVLEQLKGFSGADYLLIDPSAKRSATFAGEVGELPAVTGLSSGVEPSLGERIEVEGRAYLCRGVLLPPTHQDAGAKLYVLYPQSLRDEAVLQAIRPTLILGVVGGAVALVLTLIGVRGVVRRIRDLERRTRQVAAGDFSPVPLPPRDDELRDLAQSVNEMAAKLATLRDAVVTAERDRLLGQVSAGLAHQLRNAVTGAKLALQLHAGSCGEGDREALEVAERQLVRMAADLQRFFDLRQTTEQRVVCDIGELVGEVVDLLGPQCKHAHTELEWVPPSGSVNVLGDPGQLAHLVFNIIGNAVEAAAVGGRVWVRLRRESSRCILEVSDTGPGPPPRIAERLFEPFVTGKPEGIGLGLAVARQVAEAHGGRIAWQRTQDGQTCFRIELPCAEGRT